MSVDKARKIIEANISDRYNEGAALSDLLASAASADEKAALMEFIIENYGIIEHTGIPAPTPNRHMTAERWRELRKLEGKIMDAQIERAFVNFPPVDEASKQLLAVFESQPNDEMRDFFIANVIADTRVPYIEIPGAASAVKMTNEQFTTVSKRLVRQIRQLQYLLRDADFEQNTEQASVLLSILNTVQDPTEKVVLMTHVVLLQKHEFKRILKQVRERG